MIHAYSIEVYIGMLIVLLLLVLFNKIARSIFPGWTEAYRRSKNRSINMCGRSTPDGVNSNNSNDNVVDIQYSTFVQVEDRWYEIEPPLDNPKLIGEITAQSHPKLYQHLLLQSRPDQDKKLH